MYVRRLLLLLLSCLVVGGGLLWLTTKPDYTGPDGTRVYGPREEFSATNQTTALFYQVRWPEGQAAHSADFLHDIARHQAYSVGSGEYVMFFQEQGTDRPIAHYRFSITSDILFATRVRELTY